MAGYDIKGVKAIIMDRVHSDHAGGLEHFRGTEIPISVHEEKFNHACWVAGTKMERESPRAGEKIEYVCILQ